MQLILLFISITSAACILGENAKETRTIFGTKCECMHPSMSSQVDLEGRFNCACEKDLVRVPIQGSDTFECRPCSDPMSFKPPGSGCTPCVNAKGTSHTTISKRVNECVCRDDAAKWSVSESRCVCPKGQELNGKDICTIPMKMTRERRESVSNRIQQQLLARIEETRAELKSTFDEKHEKELMIILDSLKESLDELEKVKYKM